MEICFPGTEIYRRDKSAKDFIDGLFFATKGIMLSQIREITGLDTTIIQNWINRGWVGRPIDKRYTADHLSRILIINMLRDVASLESIAQLLTYVNGKANDKDDDIIPESALYIYLCELLDKLTFNVILSDENLNETIGEIVSDYMEPIPGGCEKLQNGLFIMATYYAASVIKNRGDTKFSEIIK